MTITIQAAVHKMAHSLPHITMITNVIIKIDIPAIDWYLCLVSPLFGFNPTRILASGSLTWFMRGGLSDMVGDCRFVDLRFFFAVGEAG